MILGSSSNYRFGCVIVLFLTSYCGFENIIPSVLGVGGVCTNSFDGFGIHLGSIHHFNDTNEATLEAVIEKLYHQLQLRHFRISYEPYFSPTENTYNITCSSPTTQGCTWTWEKLLEIMSRPPYSIDSSIFASVWTPPYYMKDSLIRLKREYETAYLHYLRNVTNLIQSTYGIEIEKISPVNEPENVFAPWDHTNMDASQLCRMVKDFNDSKVSICPENSYFWISQLYSSYKNPAQGIDCLESCSIIASHAYALNINPNSPNFLLAYYDLVPYAVNGTMLQSKEIWQTEICSTWHGAHVTQMDEGLDLATNILNFVGTTCVSRYYFWYSFTNGYSGESLIWGSRPNGTDDQVAWELTLPKKYWIFNHFSNASFAAKANADEIGESIHVEPCSRAEFSNGAPPMTSCLKFDSQNLVFVNKEELHVDLNTKVVDCSFGLCCTTESDDLHCEPEEHGHFYTLPARSVCTCKGTGQVVTETTMSSETTIATTGDTESTSLRSSSTTEGENTTAGATSAMTTLNFYFTYCMLVINFVALRNYC